MKKFIYIIFMLVFTSAVFLGCDALSPSSGDEVNLPLPTAIHISNDTQTASNPITIIVPIFYSGKIDAGIADESTLYLQELFAENGFNVTFDKIYYSLENPARYEEYFSYLSQNLVSDNTIAFVPGYKIDLLQDYVDLANLSKQIKDNAPNYYQYISRNPIVSSSIDKSLVSSISSFNDTSVVLIANSLRSKYTKSIESSDEYLGFINWAQNQNESLRSSVVLTFHDDITSRSNILYDMFLPQNGYIPLGSYLGSTYSLCVDAQKPQNIYDTATLKFYDSMLESMEVAANYQKFIIKQENTSKKNFSEYSSVVMPFGNISFYSNISDYNFYPPNYTMEILNPSMFLERKHENTYIAAPDSTDQAEALRLIDWIYSDINNYIIVKYGEAGVNYSFNENQHILLTDVGDEYTAISPISTLISNLEFESILHSMPSNYLAELNTIEYVKGDNFAKQYENYQQLITIDNYIFDSVNRFIRRWESSIRILELATELKVDHVPGAFKFDDIDDLIAEIGK